MELSPFDYTGPLPAERVTGRDALVDELIERVTARHPTALLGPRRFGKTSVLTKIAADLGEITTITIDLMPVQSPHDAVRALMAALLDADAVVAAQAESISATLGFNIAVLRGELRATRRSEQHDPTVAFSNLIDTLVKVALDRPTLIVFDEFQQIAAIDNGTAVLRTALQHHYKDVGLLFAGSQPSAMRDIFANPTQPFLFQADIVEIGPLPLGAVVELIADGFRRTGRRPGAVASLIHDFTGGHPLRTMQAAHAAWQHADDDRADQRWGEAIASLRTAARPAVSGLYEQLATDRQKVLRLVASARPLFGTEAEQLRLSTGGAQHARDRLLAEAHLTDRNGQLELVDPFLADWLRRERPVG